MANKTHRPTEKSRAEVSAYAAVGVPHHQIAKLVKLSTHTLLKHYDDELQLGKAKANATVAKTLFRLATGGNVAAAIFWLKAQAGWRESVTVDGSVKHEHTFATLFAEAMTRRVGGSADRPGAEVH